MLNRNNLPPTQFPKTSSITAKNESILTLKEQLLFLIRVLKETLFQIDIFKYRPDSEHDSVANLSPDFEDSYPNSYEAKLESIPYTDDIPVELRCPISRKIMNDPILASSGKIYDRNSLIHYFYSRRESEINCPLTPEKKIHISELNNPTHTQTEANIKIFVDKKLEEAKLNSKSTYKERDALHRARLSFFNKHSEDHATTKAIQSCSSNLSLKQG